MKNNNDPKRSETKRTQYRLSIYLRSTVRRTIERNATTLPPKGISAIQLNYSIR